MTSCNICHEPLKVLFDRELYCPNDCDKKESTNISQLNSKDWTPVFASISDNSITIKPGGERFFCKKPTRQMVLSKVKIPEWELESGTYKQIMYKNLIRVENTSSINPLKLRKVK